MDATYRRVKFMKLVGIDPVRLFWFSDNAARLDNNPIEDNMDPPMRLPDRSSAVSAVRRPMDDGSEPCKPTPESPKPTTKPFSQVTPFQVA